jgi:hypothetical protein
VDQVKKKKINEAIKHGLPLPPPKKKNVHPPKRRSKIMLLKKLSKIQKALKKLIRRDQ